MTLDELLQQAKEKSDTATKGPWKVDENVAGTRSFVTSPETDKCRGYILYGAVTNDNRETDFDFIAFARTALPLLVKIVEEYRNLASTQDAFAFDQVEWKVKCLVSDSGLP